jgi:hydrogenase nickel incorporation protein HypA/HybF
MHEYSVARALLERALVEARQRGASRVCRLSVRIGELSGVLPELLATAYALAREGTLCHDAPLEILPAPARWRCRGCGEAPAPGGVLRCPACGGELALASGDELLLERIEMEVG